METIVGLEGVSKSFGSLQVIDDLSLRLGEGEALGVVGPVAVVVMLWAPGGLWSVVLRRFDLRLFPVQQRLRLPADPVVESGGSPDP